jgi:hypothetical protein
LEGCLGRSFIYIVLFSSLIVLLYRLRALLDSYSPHLVVLIHYLRKKRTSSACQFTLAIVPRLQHASSPELSRLMSYRASA